MGITHEASARRSNEINQEGMNQKMIVILFYVCKHAIRRDPNPLNAFNPLLSTC